jgi:hypothetical protein
MIQFFTFVILEAPKVLNICVKRFQSSKSGTISKIHDPISFGMTLHIITKYGVEIYEISKVHFSI